MDNTIDNIVITTDNTKVVVTVQCIIHWAQHTIILKKTEKKQLTK